jgi:competence protein ComEA
VAERLRSVLAEPVPVRGVGRTVPPLLAALEPVSELAEIGEPLRWSDVITGWPDDVDLDPGPAEPAVAVTTGGFPQGTAWASPPGAVPADLPASPPDQAAPAGGPMDEPRSLPDPSTRPLPPPSWVLPESDDQPPPLAWTVESAAEDEPPLSPAGAFGGPAGDDRRLGMRAFDPGRRGARVLAVVAVLAVLIAALLAWRSRPRVDPVTPPSFEVAGPAGAVVEGATALPRESSAASEVLVAVAGKVRRPGLVRLPAGARVADAVNAAGGAAPGVDVTMLNLARKVVDGELILVGVTPSPGVPTGPAAPAAGGAGPVAGAPVNLNTATLADLDGLPGVGPVLAQRILDARTAQGGFAAVTDLRKVDGIGDARYEQLKDLVTV